MAANPSNTNINKELVAILERLESRIQQIENRLASASDERGVGVRILREKSLEAKDGLKRSQRRALIARGEYPAPIKLSERCSGWVEAQVDAWLKSRIAASRDVKPTAKAA